ncbi:MAG TPA: adenylate/guanylate cyclase domain-containing protein, partial [Acidimicrobiia bacterium]|nr:adenylate/guanylate cyclase domain-containing protein [Acidimicrobiia bacterium]
MRVDTEPIHLPTGTVTFMFTDIEGSTRLLADIGDDAYSDILEAHHALMREAIASGGGVEVGTEGDSFFAVFVDPLAAVETASVIQRRLSDPSWRLSEPLRVRIGVHTGQGVLGADDYVGVDVHRAHRISDAGHGGQVVLSEATTNLVEGRLPGEIDIRPLGRYRLAGLAEPVALHQLAITGLDSSFPPLRARRAESMLPKPLTEFVGRGAELATAMTILADHRLLTLTGPGGTGKTRLSLEIAVRAEPNYGDGACFAALAPLSDAGLIPMTILDALGLGTAGGIDPKEHIMRHLADREILMVLDNFEHLPDGAPLVAELLAAAPRLSIVATSRAPLRVSGERELPVPPMAVPDEDSDLDSAGMSDGVRLFVSRAEAVRPGFHLDGENAKAVVGIVQALDGLPLAIELAASRLRSLTPDAVLERLGNQILASQSADLPERQQTMTNAIGWSYDLLGPSLQELFEQLSVFSGTFGLDEAEAVCRSDIDIVDGMSELVAQSLLRQSSTRGSARFRMLTVIREFAYAALMARGDGDEVLARHASVYTDLAERSEEEILTSNQGMWLQRLTDEQDNLRAAFDHAVVVGDARTALRIAGSLWRFWQIRGFLTEGRARIERALELADGAQDRSRAQALTGLGGIMYWQGEWAEMLGPCQQALEIYRQVGSDEEISEALYNLSFAVGYAADLEEAKSLLRESLGLSERIGRSIGVGRAHWGLANMAVYEEDWNTAVDSLHRSVEVFGSLDAPFDLGWAWFMLAHSNLKMDQVERVRDPLRNSLEIFARVGDISALALILEMVATLLAIEQDRSESAYF